MGCWWCYSVYRMRNSDVVFHHHLFSGQAHRMARYSLRQNHLRRELTAWWNNCFRSRVNPNSRNWVSVGFVCIWLWTGCACEGPRWIRCHGFDWINNRSCAGQRIIIIIIIQSLMLPLTVWPVAHYNVTVALNLWIWQCMIYYNVYI